MRSIAWLCAIFLPLGCATLNESLQLGAGLGASAGAVATFAAGASVDRSTTFGDVALGAGVGAAVGLIASYFTHKEVGERRLACEADQTEMHFGDLPTSPFILPKTQFKKGAR